MMAVVRDVTPFAFTFIEWQQLSVALQRVAVVKNAFG
jgi:hypothetical protein